MKNSELSIYGNLIIDRILDLKSFPVEGRAERVIGSVRPPRFGAAANVARSYNKLTGMKPRLYSSVGTDAEGKLSYDMLESFCTPLVSQNPHAPTSAATILNCRSNSTRTGLVSWGACQNMRNFDNDGSSWKHFCYVDKLHHLTPEILSKLAGTKSADLTSFDYSEDERKRVISCLKELDYIITSKEEAEYLVHDSNDEVVTRRLGGMCKKLAIIHDPQGSYFSDGSFFQRVDHCLDMLENISVLGAGDLFAASFISKRFEQPDIEAAILDAHNLTYKVLKEGPEK